MVMKNMPDRLPLLFLFPERVSRKPWSSYTESLSELSEFLLGIIILAGQIVTDRDLTRLKTVSQA